jgi:hypothetical protein
MTSRVVIQTERLPIDLDQRRSSRTSPGYRRGRTTRQPGVVPDRAFDPADLDAQARLRRHRGNPIGDKAVPRRGVEQNGRGGEKQEQAEQQRDQPFGETRRHAAAAAPDAPRRLISLARVSRGVIHQKAWPSET